MSENKEQLTENKIIILYILNRIALPIAPLLITEILASKALMNYFTQQENIEGLIETGMMCEQVDNTEHRFYVITPEGRTTVAALEHLIPGPIKQSFDVAHEDIKNRVKRDWEIGSTQYIDDADTDIYKGSLGMYQQQMGKPK